MDKKMTNNPWGKWLRCEQTTEKRVPSRESERRGSMKPLNYLTLKVPTIWPIVMWDKNACYLSNFDSAVLSFIAQNILLKQKLMPKRSFPNFRLGKFRLHPTSTEKKVENPEVAELKSWNDKLITDFLYMNI